MAEDCLDDLIVHIASLTQVRDPDKRMLVLRRMPLVIEVVQQTTHDPAINLIWFHPLGVPGHACGYTFHVLAEGWALHPFPHQASRCANGHTHGGESTVCRMEGNRGTPTTPTSGGPPLDTRRGDPVLASCSRIFRFYEHTEPLKLYGEKLAGGRGAWRREEIVRPGMVTETAASAGGLTEILNAAFDGASDAAEVAWTAVYDDIHRMAHFALSNEKSTTQLQPTLLVHEVFLKLDRHHPDQWESRRHFFGAAARCMQQYLVDHARHRTAKRRGGGRCKLSLTVVAGELASLDAATSHELPSLLSAFSELEQESPRAAEVARLRYILGLSVRQAAQITEMSERTVKKDWAYARAWLRRELDRLD